MRRSILAYRQWVARSLRDLAFVAAAGAAAIAAASVAAPALTAPLPAQTSRDVQADSVAIIRTAEQRIALFLARWQNAWLRSDAAVVAGEPHEATRQLRTKFGHCDNDLLAPEGYPLVRVPVGSDATFAPILSNRSLYAICPTWLLGPPAREGDEATHPDAAIRTPDTLHISRMREDLVRTLEGFQDLLPNDTWLRAQRVRFLVDGHRFDRAERALDNCGTESLCQALRGYIAYQRGQPRRADSLFLEAEQAMPELERCAWNDLRSLLPDPPLDSPRADYLGRTCGENVTLARNFWWLSDPLFSVPGNERRAAHFARQIWIALHAAQDRDERHDWRTTYGGDAVRELITRYGPPSAALWIGEKEDQLHDRHLRDLHAGPYATAEYTSGRQSFTPSLSAAYQPFTAGDSSWQLHQRDGTVDAFPGTPLGFRARRDMTPTGRVWWPFEHMAYDGRVAELPAGQHVMLRRPNAVQLVATRSLLALNDTVLQHIRRDTAPVLVMHSPSPDSVAAVGRGSIAASGTLFATAMIPPDHAIISIEATHPRLRNLSARARFGVMPPGTLSTLPPDTIAISDPVFYDATRGGTPADAPSMFPHMLATTTLQQGDRLGLFWETYGVTPGDSVTFRVAVERTTRSGILQRLTEAVRLREVPLRALGIAWRDPDTRGADGASAPAIMPRSVTVDLGDLAPGKYRVVVEARTGRGDPVRGERALTIVARQ